LLIESRTISSLWLSGSLIRLVYELALIMISNAAYYKNLKKKPKIYEGFAKMVAQFRIGVVPYFGEVTF
jgi:hypothetical protein